MNVLNQMVEGEAEARDLIAQWRRDIQQKKGG
jgi:hypothetical protein